MVRVFVRLWASAGSLRYSVCIEGDVGTDGMCKTRGDHPKHQTVVELKHAEAVFKVHLAFCF